MTKEEARVMLENYLSNEYDAMDECVRLPITDININTITSENGLTIETWSFKGLLKIAYNLKDND